MSEKIIHFPVKNKKTALEEFFRGLGEIRKAVKEEKTRRKLIRFTCPHCGKTL